MNAENDEMPSESKNSEKEFLTTGDLARRLGIQRYQLMYLLETGRVPDAQVRVGGRRAFTESEASQAEAVIQGRRI